MTNNDSVNYTADMINSILGKPKKPDKKLIMSGKRKPRTTYVMDENYTYECSFIVQETQVNTDNKAIQATQLIDLKAFAFADRFGAVLDQPIPLDLEADKYLRSKIEGLCRHAINCPIDW